MNEFLNPKSMATPGAAGGAVMFLVNGVATPFPDLPQRWVALALSFLLGAILIVKVAGIGRTERLLYWTLNSLVIFAVSFGSNTLGRDATARHAASRRAALSMLISTADAGEGRPARRTRPHAEPSNAENQDAELKKQIESLKQENQQLNDKLQSDTSKAEKEEAEKKKGFFKKW